MPQVKGCETIIRMEVPSVFKSGLFARSRSDRIVAGVAAGIAERLKIDPVVIRLAFVVLSSAGGFGGFGSNNQSSSTGMPRVNKLIP